MFWATIFIWWAVLFPPIYSVCMHVHLLYPLKSWSRTWNEPEVSVNWNIAVCYQALNSKYLEKTTIQLALKEKVNCVCDMSSTVQYSTVQYSTVQLCDLITPLVLIVLLNNSWSFEHEEIWLKTSWCAISKV